MCAGKTFALLTIIKLLYYGTEACPTNSSSKHSFWFTINRVLFKIFGVLSKDYISDIQYVIILVYSRLMKQFVFVKIDLGIDILRPKMVFVVFYLSTNIVSVNNFVC